MRPHSALESAFGTSRTCRMPQAVFAYGPRPDKSSCSSTSAATGPGSTLTVTPAVAGVVGEWQAHLRP